MNFIHRSFVVATAISAALLLSACQSQPTRATASAPENAGLCNRDAAEALAGRKRVTDDEAKRLTGASSVRQIAPDSPVTLDFRQERVTIETDPASDRITRAYCG